MCLAIPACIIQLLSNDQAIIEISGVQKTVSTLLLNEIKVGDYVIIHVGYALAKLDEIEAQKTLQLFRDAGK